MKSSENNQTNEEEPVLVIEKISAGIFRATSESNGVKNQVFLNVISEEQVNLLNSIKRGIEEKEVASM